MVDTSAVKNLPCHFLATFGIPKSADFDGQNLRDSPTAANVRKQMSNDQQLDKLKGHFPIFAEELRVP
jgi:hypothetical protein